MAAVEAGPHVQPGHWLDTEPTFEVDVLGTGRILESAAVDHGSCVREQAIGAPGAAGMEAPIGRVGVSEAVRYGLLDVSVPIEALCERIPRHVVRADVDYEQLVELAFEVQLLDENLGDGAARIAVREHGRGAGRRGDRRGARRGELGVRGQIRGPGVVELVVDAQIEALDIEARAHRRCVDPGARGILILQADVADIEEDSATYRRVLAEVGRKGSRSGATGKDCREDSNAH